MFQPTEGSDFDFHLAQQKVYNLANDNKSKLAIPSDWWKNVTAAKNIWEGTYQDWLDEENRTKFVTASKNEARHNYEPFLSKTIGLLREHVAISDAQLRAADIFIQPHSSHPIPLTDKLVQLKSELTVIRRVVIHFQASGETSKAKPHGVHSAQFAWNILNRQPDDIDELVNKDLATRSPFVLDFDETDRGQTVYVCAQWVMNNGNKGKWGEIISAVIP